MYLWVIAMTEVGVLIGDLIGSRDSPDRQKLQTRLTNSLKSANRETDGDAIAPMEIVRGDEFEGGFIDPSICLETFSYLERALFPVRLKAGIGIGSISTSDETSIGRMDGPAFHRARSAVEIAKSSSSNLVIKSRNSREDEIMNTVLDLIYLIKENWTERQWEIVNYYRNHGDETQAEIASYFDISQPAVAKVLQRTKLKHIERAQEVVRERLKGYTDQS